MEIPPQNHFWLFFFFFFKTENSFPPCKLWNVFKNRLFRTNLKRFQVWIENKDDIFKTFALYVSRWYFIKNKLTSLLFIFEFPKQNYVPKNNWKLISIMLPNKLYDSLKYFQRLNGKKKVQYAISGSAFLIIRLCSFIVMACWLIDNTVTWSCSCNPLMLARPKIYSLLLIPRVFDDPRSCQMDGRVTSTYKGSWSSRYTCRKASEQGVRTHPPMVLLAMVRERGRYKSVGFLPGIRRLPGDYLLLRAKTYIYNFRGTVPLINGEEIFCVCHDDIRRQHGHRHPTGGCQKPW